jgi:hypothetical protein
VVGSLKMLLAADIGIALTVPAACAVMRAQFAPGARRSA